MSNAFAPSRLERMHEIMAGHVERGEIPGIVTLVARHDEVHVGTLGTLSRDGSEAITRDTIFRIASLTKPITAVATMILIEECKLRLDDPIDTLLPELADRRVLRSLESPLEDTVAANRPITTRDLLTFTAGYGLVMAMPDTHPIQRAMSAAGLVDGPPRPAEVPGPDELIRRLGQFPLLSQPGARWHYNTGADLLGVLIARASGQSFPPFLQERIFGPLGMQDTGFSVPTEKIARLATAYEFDWNTGNVEVYDEAVGGAWSQPPAFASGAGGLVSTADDLLAFGQMLLGRGTRGKERIISPAAVDLMTSDQLTPSQKAATGADMEIFGLDGWGFGVAVTSRRTHLSATPGRYGWDGGLGTSWSNDPANGLIGILLTQVSWTSPTPPTVREDFWNATYAALDD